MKTVVKRVEVITNNGNCRMLEIGDVLHELGNDKYRVDGTLATFTLTWNEYLEDYHTSMTQDEKNILMGRYGVNNITVTEVKNLEQPMRRWIMRLMEIAYEKGKEGVC